jgi:hypothetical protein
MREACSLIWSALALLFRSRVALAAEILVLRHQINILRRHSPKRQTFSDMDRLIFAELYRLALTALNALAVLKPDTVIKWHRAGFRSYWRWRSRRRGGRPNLSTEIRKLIREMSIVNPLWGSAAESTESCLSSASISARRAWPSIWCRDEGHHRKAGRRFFITMPTASRRWICSSCRRSRFACSLDC